MSKWLFRADFWDEDGEVRTKFLDHIPPANKDRFVRHLRQAADTLEREEWRVKQTIERT